MKRLWAHHGENCGGATLLVPRGVEEADGATALGPQEGERRGEGVAELEAE